MKRPVFPHLKLRISQSRCFLVAVLLTAFSSQLCAQDYTLENAFEKIQKYGAEKGIEVAAVYPNPSDQIVFEKDVIYKETAGATIKANLFYPQKKRKSTPAIVIIHGGGWQSGSNVLMSPMAERLAESGYFVMCPNYRLSTEAIYPAAVHDVFDALEWVVKKSKEFSIDPNNLVIMGCSAGGQLATLVGTTYNQSTNVFGKKTSGNISAIIDVDGVLAFIHPDSQESSSATKWFGGNIEEKRDLWIEASALTYVDERTPPTLFLSSIYPRFLAGRQDFIEVLNQHEVYSKTHFLEEAPHSFWLFDPWFEPTMGYITSFLEKVL